MTSIATSFTSEQVLPEGPYDHTILAGKNVLITGGTSGVGEACARAYAAAGASVTIAGMNEQVGNALATELGVAFVKTDVRSWEDQLALFKIAMQKGRLDIVLANAGVSGPDDIVKPTSEPEKPDLHIVEINLIGALYTIGLAQHFLETGLIMITASLASYVDQPGTPQYNASKFGVRGIMRSLRRTDPARGIRINIIAPWYMRAKIMSAEVMKKIESKGVPFAEVSDAAAAALHISCLPTLNGRAIAVLPRSMHSRGYMDIGKDDVDSEDLLGDWQRLALQASARV